MKNVYEAFESFKTEFLIGKKSIFTKEEDVFTRENLDFIIKNFKKNPIEGTSQGFDEKIDGQLSEASSKQKDLFAHMIWVWFVFANDMNQNGKIKSIKALAGEEVDIANIPERGIGNTGQYHKTNKPNEIAYIIDFLDAVLRNPQDHNFVEMVKKLGPTSNNYRSGGKVAMYNIFLHLFDPENFERIASYGHKEKVISFFESVFEDLNFPSDSDLDHKLQRIRQECSKDHRFQDKVESLQNGERFDFYHRDIWPLWSSDIVLESKNIILHGPPGTGKTFSVERSLKNRLQITSGPSNEFYVLVQFHPSYGYEEFIDGVKPATLDSSGNFKFELKNGTFKEMCIKAFKELRLAAEEKRKPRQYYFVADEVNRAELSRVFGELLVCIEEDKRLSIKGNKVVGTKLKTQNSNLWGKEHAVVIVNDRDELSDEGANYYFGIPENLFFIGTMNDIDRSVDSFDMALRRRFFWKQFDCDYDAVRDKFSQQPEVDLYIKICIDLNNYIASQDGLNLGDSYQLGQSYFLKPEKLNASQISKVWNNNIAPLLKEYMRAEYPEGEIESHLSKAKRIFSLK